MKICVIGTSHVAARRDAIRTGLVDLGGLDVTFWALPRGQFQSVRHESGLLRSSFPDTALLTSDGRFAELPLDRFDMLLFEGMRAPVTEWARDFRRLGRTVANYGGAFIRAAIAAVLEREHVFRIARSVARDWPRPVLVAAEPALAYATDAPVDVTADDVAQAQAALTPLLAAVNLAFQPQPPQTFTAAMFTAERFLEGALRLVDPSRPVANGQCDHMNAHYGAELWKATLDRLAADAGATPAG